MERARYLRDWFLENNDRPLVLAISSIVKLMVLIVTFITLAIVLLCFALLLLGFAFLLLSPVVFILEAINNAFELGFPSLIFHFLK